MKSFFRVLWCMIAITILCSATVVLGQNAPNKITYQGLLVYQGARNQLKIPKAGAYTLKFDFYNDSAAGTLVTTYTTANGGVTADKTGLYTVVLGENGTNSGDLDLSVFSSNLLWLQVTVIEGPSKCGIPGIPGTPYVIPTGRVQFTTVPYAGFAENVASTTKIGHVSVNRYNFIWSGSVGDICLNLPDGATLTSVDIYGYDVNDGENLTGTIMQMQTASGGQEVLATSSVACYFQDTLHLAVTGGGTVVDNFYTYYVILQTANAPNYAPWGLCATYTYSAPNAIGTPVAPPPQARLAGSQTTGRK
jgi:hypothetical protein